MNVPPYISSPQEPIMGVVNYEKDSVILAFIYWSPNSSNENYKNFHILWKFVTRNLFQSSCYCWF